MDLVKEVYLSNQIYYAKLSPTEWGPYDLGLFGKYGEPSVDMGGNFTVISVGIYNLNQNNRLIKSQFPVVQPFDPTALGISYLEAGLRAKVFVDTNEQKISAAMGNLRSQDSTTNQEEIKITVI